MPLLRSGSTPLTAFLAPIMNPTPPASGRPQLLNNDPPQKSDVVVGKEAEADIEGEEDDEITQEEDDEADAQDDDLDDDDDVEK